MDSRNLKNIVEAALLAAGGPLTIDQLCALFGEQDPPAKQDVRAVLQELKDSYEERGIELREVASGFRIQVREEMAQWLGKLWEERPPRYSRALMETLAIIAYRQPVTRGDVEEIRGVSVTTNIIRTLLERNWIKVLGHRDVPGKPAMFGTTREFLDYFNLKKLDDLPPLAELASMEPVSLQLELGAPGQPVTEEDQSGVSKADQGGASEASAAEEHDSGAEGGSQADVEAAGDADTVVDEKLLESDAAVEPDSDQPGVEDEAESDLPPGAVSPLIALNAMDDEHDEQEQAESASVASLDDARAAAAEFHANEAEESAAAGNTEPAKVVPIKST
jgi:segregation and condensation protein B